MSDFMLQYGDELLPVEGDFPEVGAYLPSFMLVGDGKQDVSLEGLGGVPKLILTLLSLDEYEHGGQYLLQETRRFLERWPQISLVVITVDSPSSLARARREHGLPHVTLLSTLRGRDFHKHYGVLIREYPLSGYTAPALLLADGSNTIHYAERLRNTQDLFDFERINHLLREAEEQALEAQQELEHEEQLKDEGPSQ